MSSGWSDHTVNPLIIFNEVKYQKADYVEMHFDLDGKGWEEKRELSLLVAKKY